MRSDPIQGILFDTPKTIQFREPLTKSEKLLSVLKKLRNLPQRVHSKSKNSKPTFSTDLMPPRKTVGSTEAGKGTTHSTGPKIPTI